MLKTIVFTVHIKEGRISSASKVSKLAGAKNKKKMIMALDGFSSPFYAFLSAMRFSPPVSSPSICLWVSPRIPQSISPASRYCPNFTPFRGIREIFYCGIRNPAMDAHVLVLCRRVLLSSALGVKF